MTEIRPVDLPALRDETVRAVDNDEYRRLLKQNVTRTGNRHPIFGHYSADKMVTLTAAWLEEAELYYASADMTALAAAASATLPDFELQPEDVPCDAGFLLFGGALPPVLHGEPPLGVHVAGYAWTDIDASGVLFHPFSWRESMLGALQEAGIVTAATAEHNRRRMARIMPMEDHATWAPYGASTGDTKSLGLQAVLKTLRAAWLLMAQPVATVNDAAYDRATRRRFRREGKEPPRVRVITLRRSVSSASGESDREYHHQWIVRGHWRQQWYPVRQVHRPVWIAPHVKGPEGAPLLAGEKVYAWTR